MGGKTYSYQNNIYKMLQQTMDPLIFGNIVTKLIINDITVKKKKKTIHFFMTYF